MEFPQCEKLSKLYRYIYTDMYCAILVAGERVALARNGGEGARRGYLESFLPCSFSNRLSSLSNSFSAMASSSSSICDSVRRLRPRREDRSTHLLDTLDLGNVVH